MKFYSQFAHTLDFCDVPYCCEGIEANLDEYKKYDLIRLLERHPKWNSEINSIILTVKETKYVFNPDQMQNQMLLIRYSFEHDDAKKAWDAMPPYSWLNVRFITDDLVRYLQEWCDTYPALEKVKPKVGQKMSRFLRKAMVALGEDPDHNPELKTEFEKLADGLSEYEIDRPLIISVNPCDFLTMSYGTNWASCHIINPSIALGGNTYSGCFKAGTLSYANDESTIIVYTVRELPEDLRDLPITPRMTRQLFMLNPDNGILVQSRFYPYTNDTNQIDNFRAIMQDVISTCYGKPNFWKLSRDEFDEEAFCSDERGLHYKDYEFTNEFHISTCYLQGVEQTGTVSTIGNAGYYLNSHYENRICDADEVTSVSECAHCGAHIDHDEAIEINGDSYCPDCVIFCSDCGNPVLVEDAVEIGYGNWVCRECIADNYYVCENCGEYVHERDVYFDKDGCAWCEECAQSHLSYCEDCNEYVRDEDMVELENGDMVCTDCAHERENAK